MTQSQFRISGLCVALSALAFTTGVCAQEKTYDVRNSYFGLSVGQSDYRLGDGNLYSAEHQNIAYSGNVGGYFRNSNLGLELGYIDFGKVGRAGGTTKAQGVSLDLIGRLPLSNAFNLLGKVGGVYSYTDVSARAGSGIAAGSENGMDWTYGLGVEFAFARQWSAVAQYDDYYLKFAGGGRDRVSNLSAGLRYVY
jgi:OmpA-OmpF porin, OOP family